MTLGPRFREAIKHVYTAWIRGCKCRLCQAVDAQKSIEEFFGRKG